MNNADVVATAGALHESAVDRAVDALAGVCGR